MPVAKGQSSLLTKLGQRGVKAHEAHKSDETQYSSFGDLPAGIEGGIAQLETVKFDQYKNGDMKGEYFFMARATVKQPIEVKEFGRVAGLSTQIGPEPMCDTPTRSRKTLEEHIEWVYNELRKMGIQTQGLELSELEGTAKALEEMQPYIKFRTWKGEKQTEGDYKDREPRTQHQWNGTIEFSDNGDGQVSGTQDDSPSSSESGDAGASAGAGDTADDVAALLASANAQDGTAQNRLIELAVGVGHTREDLEDADKFPSWEAIVEAISNPPAEAPTPTSNEPELSKDNPKVGEVFKFYPVDAKGKKAPKPVEGEITAVMARAKTVKIKDLNTKKEHDKVKFADLIVP